MERRVGVGVVSTSMVVALGGSGVVVGVWDAGAFGAIRASSPHTDAARLSLKPLGDAAPVTAGLLALLNAGVAPIFAARQAVLQVSRAAFDLGIPGGGGLIDSVSSLEL